MKAYSNYDEKKMDECVDTTCIHEKVSFQNAAALRSVLLAEIIAFVAKFPDSRNILFTLHEHPQEAFKTILAQ